MWNHIFLAAIFLIILSSAPLSLSQRNANYVLGSINLSTKGTIPNPQGVHVSPLSGKVFISNGTLIYRFENSALTTNGASPEAVLGTPGVCNDGGLLALNYITIDESDSLWGPDSQGNRVFKAESISSSTNLSFSFVLGQNSSTDCGYPGNQLNQMYGPYHALLDSSKNDLWVADMANNRVLRFNNASSLATGANATTFLGTGSSGTSAVSLNFPFSVALDSQGNLYVADTRNYRVVRFDNAHNLESGAEASLVLGQPDFNTSEYHINPTQSLLSNPTFVFLFDDVLYVSDLIYYRVMIFSNVTALQNGAPATNLLGQSSFNVASYGPIAPYSIDNPFGIYCDSKSLLVVSSDEYRVLGFNMPLPPLPSPSSSSSPSPPSSLSLSLSLSLSQEASPDSSNTALIVGLSLTATAVVIAIIAIGIFIAIRKYKERQLMDQYRSLPQYETNFSTF